MYEFRLVLLFLFLISPLHADDGMDEESARKFLQEIDGISGELKNKAALSSWDYASNITDENLQIQVGNLFLSRLSHFLKKARKRL